MMQGQLERDLRDAWAARMIRKFGLTPAAVTLGMHEVATGTQVRQSRLQMGRPVILQDSNGNTTYLPGMDGPVG